VKESYVLNKIKGERAAKILKQQNETPLLSRAGSVSGKVMVIDTLNPSRSYSAKVVKTAKRNGRLVVTRLECPECRHPMEWDTKWKAFRCTDHGHKGIYELI